jgi:putative transposase
MLWLIFGLFTWLTSFLRSRHDLGLEIVALRQQLVVLKRRTKRAHLRRSDRLFWVMLRRVWAKWPNPLLIVKPDTVVRWHRKGFRLYWRFRSRSERVGRPVIARDVRASIHTMASENPTWGAPRVHGELLKLGFEISERTVSRYLSRLQPSDRAAQLWRTFLKNHREVIAGMDFFTVITANFRILYCLFLIQHDRRKIIYLNVTEHPTGEWVVQQLREAFSETRDDQYLIFDRDAKFSADMHQFLDSAGISAVRTSYRSPWQNGVAERWVRSFRNDLLDHVIVLHETHLRRLARDYLGYYHADRTHDGLDKDTPQGRPPSIRNPGERLASHPRLGGLHHRYSWAKVA